MSQELHFVLYMYYVVYISILYLESCDKIFQTWKQLFHSHYLSFFLFNNDNKKYLSSISVSYQYQREFYRANTSYVARNCFKLYQQRHTQWIIRPECCRTPHYLCNNNSNRKMATLNGNFLHFASPLTFICRDMIALVSPLQFFAYTVYVPV